MKKYIVLTGKTSKEYKYVKVDGRKKALRAAGLPDNLNLACPDEARWGAEVTIEDAKNILFSKLSAAAVEASPIYKKIMSVVRQYENVSKRFAALHAINIEEYTRPMGSGGVGQIMVMSRKNEIRIQVAAGWGRWNYAPAVVLTFDEYVGGCNKYRQEIAEAEAASQAAKNRARQNS